MKSKICLWATLLLIATSMSFLVSCESEGCFEEFEANSVESIYLSLSDEDLASITRFSNPIFNTAKSRFNKTKKIENGEIVQALNEEELMMSKNLIEYFYLELEQTNEDIKSGKLLLYSNSENPFDFCCYDASFKMRTFAKSLTRSPENNDSDNNALNLQDADSDDIMNMLDRMDSDHSGEGYNYFNEYVDMGSYENWNMGNPTFSKSYAMEIGGVSHSYTMNINNIKYANGGNSFPGMYSICQVNDYSTNGNYLISYENGRGDCLMSIQTRSYEVYQRMK